MLPGSRLRLMIRADAGRGTALRPPPCGEDRASVCRNRGYDVRPIDVTPGRATLAPLVFSGRRSLYVIGLVVVPTSFDVDLDTVTLLAVGLIVVIAFGVGWIVRGRR